MLAIAGLPLDDVQQIFVVLTTLYAIECCWWLRGDTRRIFRRPFPRWSDRPAESTTVDAWRLSCSNPWPGGEAYAAQPFPIPFDHAGLLIAQLDATTGSETYRRFSFEELEPIVARGLDVYAGGRRLAGCSSKRCASALARRLERLRATSANDRPAVSEAVLAEIWSLPEARQRLARWRRDCRTLRRLGGILAGTAILAGPLAYALRHELHPQVPFALLITFVGLWLATSIAGLLLPSGQNESGLDLTHRLTPFLSPASAMRLYDTAGRDTLADHEPLIVALANGEPGGPDSLAAAWFRDALFPARRPSIPADDPLTAAALQWFRDRSAQHARTAIASTGLKPDDLLMPASTPPDVRSYCPRCGRQFTVDAATCLACDLASAPLVRR